MKSLFSREEADIPQKMMCLLGNVDLDNIMQFQINTPEYQNLLQMSVKLQNQYPVIEEVMESMGKVTLRKEEHKAFHEYLQLKSDMEYLERQQAYQCGYVHCYECLRKMGALRGNEDERI